jgi:uncharacterized membrane protein
VGAISRGWALTKQSGAVLRNDQSLLVFPALSTIFAIMALVAIWLPTAVLTGVFQTETVDESNPYYVVAMIVTAYVSTFIAIFFNVALATCAVRSLRGEDTTVGQGLSAAMQRIGPIVGWSLVAATVGWILRFLEDRLPLAGKIAVWIAGAAWAVATFFVVPVVALEGAGPWRSLKLPVEVVKARWGESGRRLRRRGHRGRDHLQCSQRDLPRRGLPVRGDRRGPRGVRQPSGAERVRRAHVQGLTAGSGYPDPQGRPGRRGEAGELCGPLSGGGPPMR